MGSDLARDESSNMRSVATGAVIGASVGAAYVLVSHKRKHGSLRSNGAAASEDGESAPAKRESRWRGPVLGELMRDAAQHALAAGAGAAAEALKPGRHGGGEGEPIAATLSRAAREAGRAAADSLATQAGGGGRGDGTDDGNER